MSWLLQIMLQYTRGHVYLKELVLSFSWDKYSQVELIAGSYDSSLSVSLSLSLSLFLRYLHPIFHSGCTNLHPHQYYTPLPFSPYSCQNLFLIFLIRAMLIVWRGYLWGFDLHFPGDKWCWECFHIFFGHACVIREKVCSDLLPIY